MGQRAAAVVATDHPAAGGAAGAVGSGLGAPRVRADDVTPYLGAAGCGWCLCKLCEDIIEFKVLINNIT